MGNKVAVSSVVRIGEFMARRDQVLDPLRRMSLQPAMKQCRNELMALEATLRSNLEDAEKNYNLEIQNLRSLEKAGEKMGEVGAAVIQSRATRMQASADRRLQASIEACEKLLDEFVDKYKPQ